MCGICGIFGYEDRNLVERMLLSINHRGPDGHDLYSDCNISLGHARLSINDLSDLGKQPMSNEEGTIWISVNGEIYNFHQLRLDLEKKGHNFLSNSDSETILHLYEEYDLSFVKYINGMFAIALYDSIKKRLLLVRDPIGKKPLYYYHDKKIIAFASEIKALLQMNISFDIDYESVWSYLAYQYVLGDSTFFKKIHKLLPGTILVSDENGMSITRYWDIHERIIQIDDDSASKQLRELLERSVKYRMISDVPVGSFLSGGIDSSAIVALARPHAQDSFHTFSVGFETYSELDYAQLVADHIDSNHHELTISTDMVLSHLERIAWINDEPLGDAAVINNYFLSKAAKKYVSVVLAGEGGDEVFAGYPTYQSHLAMYNALRIPIIQRNFFKIIEKLPVNYDIFDTSYYNSYHRSCSCYYDTSIERVHLNTSRLMIDKEIEQLTTLKKTDINNNANLPSPMSIPLNKMLATDCTNLLPEKFLMKADKGTMAHAIEERSPLIDISIINFAFSLPSHFKIRAGQEKYILRKAVSDLLPKKIIDRPKKGFNTTIGHWIENGLGEVILHVVDQGEFLKHILKKEKFNSLIHNIDKMGDKRPYNLWTFFALELWYNQYFCSEN